VHLELKRRMKTNTVMMNKMLNVNKIDGIKNNFRQKVITHAA